MKSIACVDGWCECSEPDAGWDDSDYIAVGCPGNIVDYNLCLRCGLPVRGTASTHG